MKCSNSPQLFSLRISNLWIKIKVICFMVFLFFKEIYELLTGKRKWS